MVKRNVVMRALQRLPKPTRRWTSERADSASSPAIRFWAVIRNDTTSDRRVDPLINEGLAYLHGGRRDAPPKYAVMLWQIRKGPPPKERPFHAFRAVETRRSAGGRHRTPKLIASAERPVAVMALATAGTVGNRPTVGQGQAMR